MKNKNIYALRLTVIFSTSVQNLSSENLEVNPVIDPLIPEVYWFGAAKSWTTNASKMQHLKPSSFEMWSNHLTCDAEYMLRFKGVLSSLLLRSPSTGHKGSSV